MAASCRAVLAVGFVTLAACATDPPAPPAERHRCIVIPNDLVECFVVDDAGGPAPR
jgi:hypothetical protein